MPHPVGNGIKFWKEVAVEGTDPTATKAATKGKRHFINTVVVFVDTADRTMTLKNGTVIIFEAKSLGIGTHIFPLDGIPADNENELVSAELDTGTTQQCVMHGFSRSTEE